MTINQSPTSWEEKLKEIQLRCEWPDHSWILSYFREIILSERAKTAAEERKTIKQSLHEIFAMEIAWCERNNPDNHRGFMNGINQADNFVEKYFALLTKTK